MRQFGQHQPPAFDEPAGQDQHAGGDHDEAAAFAPQQQRKRHKKTGDRDDPGDGLPRAGDAAQIPRDFVREVLLPHDQELTELDIGPEDHRREQDRGEIAEVVADQHARRLHRDDDQNQGEPGIEPVCPGDHRKYRRPEMRIERQDPVDGRETRGVGEQHQADCAEPAQTGLDPESDAARRPQRISRDAVPQHDINRVTQHKKSGVQVPGVAEIARAGPGIDRAQPEQYWNAGKRRDGHRRCRSGERGARARHPGAAGQIVHQDQRHGAERHAKPEDVSAQPAAVKRRSVAGGTNRTADYADGERRQRSKLDPRPDTFTAHWNCCRLAAGTSASFALPLACSARI